MRGYAADPVRGAGWFSGQPRAGNAGRLARLFDVAADDVLNLRDGPSADAAIIGAFQPDRVDIEVVRPNDDESWGLVNLPETTAWVAMRYLARQPGQWQGAFPDLASCSGTEPFWTLDIDGDMARWITPESDITGSVQRRLASAARRDRHGLVAVIDDAPLSGIIAARQCSDGMSDREYGLSLDAIFGEQVLSGCCTLAP